MLELGEFVNARDYFVSLLASQVGRDQLSVKHTEEVEVE